MDKLESLESVEVNDEMRFIAHKDIATRSFVGTYIYLLSWAVITVPSDFYAIAPDISLFFSLSFLTMALIRGLLIKNFEKIYQRNPIYWKTLFFTAVWTTALLWGVLCYLALSDPRFENISLAIVIATAGLSSGGVVALLPSRTLTLGLYSALLLPTGSLVFHPDFDDITIVLIFLLYWGGMYSITKVQYRDYWLGLKSNFLIKRHAIILEQLNTLDGLTGLKNRKYFDESLHREVNNALRSQSHLSLLFLDIDHFKMINDNYGHIVGDECLKRISTLFQETLQRKTDTVARYGGEEFAIILPSDNTTKALALAEKIRRSVEELRYVNEKINISFTISIGVASFIPKPGDTAESLIKMADKALYLAKDAGRNRVIEAGKREKENIIYFDI